MSIYKWYKYELKKYIVDQNWEVRGSVLGEGCENSLLYHLHMVGEKEILSLKKLRAKGIIYLLLHK